MCWSPRSGKMTQSRLLFGVVGQTTVWITLISGKVAFWLWPKQSNDYSGGDKPARTVVPCLGDFLRLSFPRMRAFFPA
jgi:hypothetical protein